MEYQIVAAASASRLEDLVHLFIKDGFIPQGGICYSCGRFYQAIIKYEVTITKLTTKGIF